MVELEQARGVAGTNQLPNCVGKRRGFDEVCCDRAGFVGIVDREHDGLFTHFGERAGERRV